MLGTALTAIIGTIAKGKASKAIAATVGGALSIPVVQPLADALFDGLLSGAVPEVKKAGTVIGATLAIMATNWILTWFAPANKPAK